MLGVSTWNPLRCLGAATACSRQPAAPIRRASSSFDSIHSTRTRHVGRGGARARRRERDASGEAAGGVDGGGRAEPRRVHMRDALLQATTTATPSPR
eukprot:scaffold781_cov394-Prasinococcus_capsulatus_cf.AAC.33